MITTSIMVACYDIFFATKKKTDNNMYVDCFEFQPLGLFPLFTV